MTQHNEYCVILTTCGDEEEAERLARLLIEKKLAACIQLTGVTSFYEWERKVNRDSEILLLIKTRSSLYEEIESVISENHSYELPEIIKLSIDNGLDGYLGWIDEVSRK